MIWHLGIKCKNVVHTIYTYWLLIPRYMLEFGWLRREWDSQLPDEVNRHSAQPHDVHDITASQPLDIHNVTVSRLLDIDDVMTSRHHDIDNQCPQRGYFKRPYVYLTEVCKQIFYFLFQRVSGTLFEWPPTFLKVNTWWKFRWNLEDVLIYCPKEAHTLCWSQFIFPPEHHFNFLLAPF